MRAGPSPASSAPSKMPASSRSSTSAQHRSRARRASPRTSSRPIFPRLASPIAICEPGTSKRGREAARSGDVERFERIFLEHMEEPEALVDLGEAIALAKAQPVCLLCLERDPEHCHRMIVGSRMVAKTGQKLRHLFVDAEGA